MLFLLEGAGLEIGEFGGIRQLYPLIRPA